MKTINYCGREISPSKVVCVGRNFVEHIKELNNEIPSSMVLFNKPNSAITNELLHISSDLHFESEITFLIIDSQIAGVGFGLDLTKRELQSFLKSKSLPWERAKAFDNSAVFSDFVKLDVPIESLRLTLEINGKLQQSGGHNLMIYKPSEILEEIKSFLTLEDGDLIMSGTPKGVGTFQKGDTFIGKVYSENRLLIEKKWISK